MMGIKGQGGAFKPKIDITNGYLPGYGGGAHYWSEGVFDNRLLFKVKGDTEGEVAVRAERLRLKWEKAWPSKEAFIAKISAKPLAKLLCSNCNLPGANISCIDRLWCDRSACRVALDVAKDQYEKTQGQIRAENEGRWETERLKRVRACDAAARGFHWQDGWFFKRRPDGSVRVVHRDSPQAEYLAADIIIPALQWASIVCSVSAEGETGERWEAAQGFHGRPAKSEAETPTLPLRNPSNTGSSS